MKHTKLENRKSRSTYGLTGQNNGTQKSKTQTAQRSKQLGRNHMLSGRSKNAVQSQSVINYKPRSIMSLAGTVKDITQQSYKTGRYIRTRTGAIRFIKN